MATYSALFSSGLLAPRIARSTTPVSPASPVDPVDCQLNQIQTLALSGQSSPGPSTDRPRMRRRRSSINVGASPMALIKSPVRNAGAALQRTGFGSPSRHRSGSVGMNDALQSNSLFGRLRSESVGAIANPLKRLRRAVRLPAPLAPPPSAPLPALPPSSPTVNYGDSIPPLAVFAPMSRQPLGTRHPHIENAGDLFSPKLSPATLANATQKMPFKAPQGFPGFRNDAIDEAMQEY